MTRGYEILPPTLALSKTSKTYYYSTYLLKKCWCSILFLMFNSVNCKEVCW